MCPYLLLPHSRNLSTVHCGFPVCPLGTPGIVRSGLLYTIREEVFYYSSYACKPGSPLSLSSVSHADDENTTECSHHGQPLPYLTSLSGHSVKRRASFIRQRKTLMMTMHCIASHRMAYFAFVCVCVCVAINRQISVARIEELHILAQDAKQTSSLFVVRK